MARRSRDEHSGRDHLREDVRTLGDELRELRAEIAADNRALREEIAADNRALRQEMAAEFRSVRGELSTLHGRLTMIGFGLVGSVLASAVAVIIAISS